MRRTPTTPTAGRILHDRTQAKVFTLAVFAIFTDKNTPRIVANTLAVTIFRVVLARSDNVIDVCHKKVRRHGE